VPRQERRECVAFAQPVEPGFHEGPGQQAGGRKDEDDDDGLVFERVAFCWCQSTSTHVPKGGYVRKQVVKTSSSLASLQMGRL
jgi:hypothetical protein